MFKDLDEFVEPLLSNEKQYKALKSWFICILCAELIMLVFSKNLFEIYLCISIIFFGIFLQA